MGGGRFAPNGASAPTSLGGSLTGLYTVARSGTGLFTVTFTSKAFSVPYLPVILVTPTTVDDSANLFDLHLASDWAPATRSFTIQANHAGVAADIAAGANAQIGFWIEFRSKK